jgi:GGDEF domain-containing protein
VVALDAQVRRLASVLVTNVRGQDEVFRLGPVTFGVILPETDSPGVRALVARLQAGVGPEVTIGGGSYPTDAEDVPGLLHRAEEGRRGVAWSRPSTR